MESGTETALAADADRMRGSTAQEAKWRAMIIRESVKVGDKEITIETGRIAKQAAGSVLVSSGETMVLVTVCGAKEARPGQPFFPLTVDYVEKTYAAGKIPGGVFKREARPTEKETLTARLIARPIRPLFVPGFKNEVLVMCTVLSHDLVNDPDIVAMIAASASASTQAVLSTRPSPGIDRRRSPPEATSRSSRPSPPAIASVRPSGEALA